MSKKNNIADELELLKLKVNKSLKNYIETRGLYCKIKPKYMSYACHSELPYRIIKGVVYYSPDKFHAVKWEALDLDKKVKLLKIISDKNLFNKYYTSSYHPYKYRKLMDEVAQDWIHHKKLPNNIEDIIAGTKAEIQSSSSKGKTKEQIYSECQVIVFSKGEWMFIEPVGVRLIHRPTGIVSECREHDSFCVNLQECLNTLATKINDEEHEF